MNSETNLERLSAISGDPEWGTQWHIGKISYIELEAELANGEDNA